jgi:hypothetical protein
MACRRNGHRLLVLALALTLFLLTACSGGSAEADGTATGAEAAAPATGAAAEEITAASLPELGVLPGDLPEGFSVRHEGYVEADQPVEAVYRRALDPSDTRLGSSELADLVSDVALFASSAVAEEAIDTIFHGLTSAAVEPFFSGIVRAYTGIDVEDLNGQTLASPVVGDGTVVGRAFFDSPAGRAEALLFVIRVGPLHANLFLIGRPGRVEFQDAARLASVVAARMEAAVAAAPPEA